MLPLRPNFGTMATQLFKYLDADGGLSMLKCGNLQFTNASKFNDPFDCHPALFDFSNAPTNERNWPPKGFLTMKGQSDMENLRNETWICSLSKVYDSLLMWAYYTSHKGICIGLNKEALEKSCSDRYLGMIYPYFQDVKYLDIHNKQDYFHESYAEDYLLTTKAKEWEHEQEVRIIAKEPAWWDGGMDVPKDLKKEKMIDGREIRYYPRISNECFESIYLGVNMFEKKRNDIIEVARKRNPNIQIYQMTLDPDAFRLKAELIEL